MYIIAIQAVERGADLRRAGVVFPDFYGALAAAVAIL